MSCENHKKEIAGITDMKVLAEMIGDLHYETLMELFSDLTTKFKKDCISDADAGRGSLSNKLMRISKLFREVTIEAAEAWMISKPFMTDNQSKTTQP